MLADLAFVALVCCTTRSLPELPEIDLGQFQGEVGNAITRQYAEAKANPMDAKQVLQLGMLLHAHEQFQAAAQSYARVHALDPQRFDALYYWGQALASIGDYAHAAARLRQSLAVRPVSVPARLKLADVLRELGETKQSAGLYRAVLTEQPDNPTAHYGLGRLLDDRSAIEEFRKALAVFPRYGAAQFALASAYRSIGDPIAAQAASRDYDRDKTLIPPVNDPEMVALHALNVSPTGLLGRAAELEQDGRLQEALDLLNRAIAMNPKLVDAYINMISICGRLGRNQQAEEAYRQAVQLDPNQSEAYYNFGVFCFERQRPEDAKTAFERTVRLNPRHAEALHNWGVLLERETKWDQAVDLYRRALDARSSYPAAHFHLGRIYANQRNYALAIQEFEKSLEPSSDATPTYLYAFAATTARAGARGRAVELMRQARAQAQARGQAALVASIDRDLDALGAAR